jgi:hypothetical protein
MSDHSKIEWVDSFLSSTHPSDEIHGYQIKFMK